MASSGKERRKRTASEKSFAFAVEPSAAQAALSRHWLTASVNVFALVSATPTSCGVGAWNGTDRVRSGTSSRRYVFASFRFDRSGAIR